MKNLMKSSGFRLLGSPWVTCALLVACMVVVFFGTIEQPANGLRPVQRHYFEAWAAVWPMAAAARPGGWLCLPLPGGFALGAMLLVNLVFAAARFFRPSWRKAGVALIHVGLVVLLAGGFAIAALQEEFFMEIPQGESRDFVEPIADAPASAPPAAAAVAPPTPRRVVLPFALHLDKFTHEVYPGSTIPKNFASNLRILEKSGTTNTNGGGGGVSGVTNASVVGAGRAVEIRMNAPLRHGGYSFFQSSFRYDPVDNRPTTVLQVVRNPGWALPYVAFYLVGAGMLLQFLTTLVLFLAKRAKPPAAAALAAAAAVFAAVGIAPNANASEAAAAPSPASAAAPAAAAVTMRDVAREFAQLPVQYNGRLQPADSFARNTLLLLRGRQTVSFTKEAAVMFGTRPSKWTLPEAQLQAATGIRLSPDERDMLERAPVPLRVGILGTGTLDADAWLLEVAFRPALAARFPLIRVENTEVRNLLDTAVRDHLGPAAPAPKTGAIAHYSWSEISVAFDKLHAAAAPLQGKKPADYTAFEHGIAKLNTAMDAYATAAYTYAPPDLPAGRLPNDEYTEWAQLNRHILAARTAMLAPANAAAAAPPPLLARPAPQLDEITMHRLNDFLKRYHEFAERGIGIVPPAAHAHHAADPAASHAAARWDNLGQTLTHRHPGAAHADFEPPALLRRYGDLAAAWDAGDAPAAARATAALTQIYRATAAQPDPRLRAEVTFNRVEPFFKSLVLYVAVFLLVLAAWATGQRRLRAAAFILALAVLALHTAAIGARMWIQDRPPVTNLYSTAIVVSWGAVVLGLFIERYLRNGIGTAVAAITGFASLIVAHNLAMNGDTMGMMQAVLDDNFWLTTHVVTITLGYSGMFAAGLLGALWIFRRALGANDGNAPAAADPKRHGRPAHDSAAAEDTSSSAAPRGTGGSPVFRAEDAGDRDGTGAPQKSPPAAATASAAADPLERVVHGVVCFALLLSFAGTMLGGLWADKSWGRFWGWDPKENGALLVVLWCAVFLHARAFRLLRPRGLMQLAVAGNIVTAASWFGTNLLATGLHSYGFSQGGFFWLALFWLSQLLLILLAFLPPLRRRRGDRD